MKSRTIFMFDLLDNSGDFEPKSLQICQMLSNGAFQKIIEVDLDQVISDEDHHVLKVTLNGETPQQNDSIQ